MINMSNKIISDSLTSTYTITQKTVDELTHTHYTNMNPCTLAQSHRRIYTVSQKMSQV